LPLISFESSIRKKYINFQVQGAFCKTSCWLTEEFDRGGKLINVVQFQGVIEVFVNVKEIIDETYNFEGVIPIYSWNFCTEVHFFGIWELS